MVMSLIVESAIWYAIGVVTTVSRFTSHKVVLGSFKRYELHDALALFAVATQTVLLVILNVLNHKKTNLINPKDHPVLTPQDIAERTWGSKLVVVSEQMQMMTIWLIKLCFLLMYNNIAFNRTQKLCVKLVIGYVLFGFLLMEILYLGVWCRPFHHYWQVPTNNIQCSAATHHLITNAVLNVSSDLFILCIPMPVLFAVTFTPKKKAILSVIFILGLFTIGCAIAGKFFSFTEPYSAKWTRWYIRESSTAIIVANIPFLWAILRRVLKLGPLFATSLAGTGAPTSQRHVYGHNVRYVSHNTTITRGPNAGSFGRDFAVLDSREDVNSTSSVPLRIFKHQEVHVSSEVSDAPEGERNSKDHFEFGA
ncbi:hypothetical protein GGR50DRAFT_645997 [Xylaria sp. CBS 124048]|nr:hypothetical protein GGR50DRAFT_645997 [Xylaria sp. CBS 124048]